MPRRPLKGAPLQPGQTIGVIAPASPSDPERIKRGIEFIESCGFKVRVALDPSEQYGKKDHLFSSDTAKARAKALHDLFKDKSVRAIVTTRGGYGGMEILPLLNYKLIAKNPKPLIGFSDTTVLLTNLYHRSGLVTVHGASVETMSRAGESEKAKVNAHALIGLLSGGDFPELELTRLQGKKEVTAPLLVGSLSLISSLMGTPYEPKFDAHLVCFEDCGEKPFRVHRMLLQMKLAGKFKRAAGIILGSFKNCEHPQGLGPTVEEVFRDIFSDQKFPVLSGAPFGHDEDNLPFPLGVKARVKGNSLEFLESPVLE
jgi:muramoyltetrapeptide carboxypeptidase